MEQKKVMEIGLYTDFSLRNCTNENCDRRRQYLLVALNY